MGVNLIEHIVVRVYEDHNKIRVCRDRPVELILVEAGSVRLGSVGLGSVGLGSVGLGSVELGLVEL